MRSCMYVATILFMFFLSPPSSAGVTCKVNNGSSYCNFVGKIKHVYVNEANLILIYFDEGIETSELASFGFNASNGQAAAYAMQDNMEFAKMLYATVLAAYAANKTVQIQMHETRLGYMKADRIWAM